MAEYGIKGERSAGGKPVSGLTRTCRAGERKICAIGVRCSRWVYAWIAFNVNTDLSYFNHIIPCGIVNKQVTSLQQELGRKLEMQEVKGKVKRNFEQVFESTLISEVFL